MGKIKTLLLTGVIMGFGWQAMADPTQIGLGNSQQAQGQQQGQGQAQGQQQGQQMSRHHFEKR